MNHPNPALDLPRPTPGPAFLAKVDPEGKVHRASEGEEGTRYPVAEQVTPGSWGLFVIAEGEAHLQGDVLAAPNSALAQLYAIAHRRNLTPDFPPAVLEEMEHWVEDPGIQNEDLLDLTHLLFLTIDEVHSKDLDQALFLERRDEGFGVWYAIADASWFVRPGTALFAEALARGATYYLPGLVLPMLPKVLSEDLVSLNPGVDRRALVFEVHLEDDGTVRSTQLHRGRVRSRVKTSYDAVQAFYDGKAPVPGGPHPGSPPPPEEEAIGRSLEVLREVGAKRRALAEARHVIGFRRQELAVSLAGIEGLRFVALADPRNDVERDNEQISLLCNIEGARYLRSGAQPGDGVEGIFRVHDPPTHQSLDQLSHDLDALVDLHDLPESWRWHRRDGRSLADYLRSLPTTGPWARLARAVHRQAMLTGGRSLFATVPGKHFGVGAEVYSRFTAPMREVVGVFVHKETWEKLHGAPPPPEAPWHDDKRLRQKVIEASNRARQRQRQLDREANGLVLDQLFGDDARRPVEERPWRPGTVLGISRGKVHIGLDDPPIDIKVYQYHLERQRGHRVHQGRDGVTLRTGDEVLCSVGDEVAVRVHRRDASRERWDLELGPVSAS